MAWAAVAGAAISGGVAVYKGIKGAQQTAQANRLLAQQPGYQMNQGVLDNAKILSDYYGNYQLPGYQQDVDNINNTFGSAFYQGKQGATSGADVQDLAARIAYGKNQAFNQLGQQTAQGKQAAFSGMLNGNAAAGQEYVNKNQFEQERYQQLLRQKAALTQAGAQNTYGALDQLAGIASKYAFTQAGGPPNTAALNAAGATSGSGNNQYYYPNGSPRFDGLGNPIPQGAAVQSQYDS